MHGSFESRAQSLIRAFDLFFCLGALRERALVELEVVHGLPRAHAEWALGSPIDEERVRTWIRDHGSTALPSFRHGIVLSGNLFVVGFPTLFWSLVLGHSCFIRSSTRAAGFLPLFMEALTQIDARLAQRVEFVEFSHDDELAWKTFLRSLDCLTAFGGDQAMAAIASMLVPEQKVFAHGHGVGVAVVSPDDLSELPSLARDICAYDGRGCLSPAHVLVLGDERENTQVGVELERHLAAQNKIWPRGLLAPSESAADNAWRDVAAMEGELFEGHGYSVAIGCQRFGSLRNIGVASHPTVQAVKQFLREQANVLTTIGMSSSLRETIEPSSSRTRVVPLGQMQVSLSEGLWTPLDGRPPWEGMLA